MQSRRDSIFFILTFLTGCVSHFIYEWSGRSPLAALFFPVSESVWEHLKLLFFPFLFFSVIQYFLYGFSTGADDYFFRRLIGALCGIFFIIAGYFTYTGIFGRHFLPVDIFLLIAGIRLAFKVSERIKKTVPHHPLTGTKVFLAWLFISLLFFLFTCFPPETPLFLAPS